MGKCLYNIKLYRHFSNNNLCEGGCAMSSEKKPNDMTFIDLTNELLYQRYLMYRLNGHDFSSQLNILEYSILRMASKKQKLYLKEISQHFEIPMKHLSKIIGRMRDEGVIIWTHDDYGEKGTYIKATPYGIEQLNKQEAKLRKDYKEIINTVGRDRIYEYINTTRQIIDILQNNNK